jgi:uncharacterized membrane protein
VPSSPRPARSRPPASTPAPDPTSGARRGSPATLVVAAIGLAISAYLTVEHYTTSALLACPESATINCAKVTTSRWSHVVGVPVALLGLLYFVAMTALLLPWSWRRADLDAVRVVGVALGALTVLYLVSIELFAVDAICLWCTAVHICMITLLALVLWHTGVVRTEGPTP